MNENNTALKPGDLWHVNKQNFTVKINLPDAGHKCKVRMAVVLDVASNYVVGLCLSCRRQSEIALMALIDAMERYGYTQKKLLMFRNSYNPLETTKQLATYRAIAPDVIFANTDNHGIYPLLKHRLSEIKKHCQENCPIHWGLDISRNDVANLLPALNSRGARRCARTTARQCALTGA